MADWLENKEESETKVVSIVNGEKEEHDVDTSRPLKDVVKEISEEKGFTAIIVKADGVQIGAENGAKNVNQFKLVEIIPKHVGA